MMFVLVVYSYIDCVVGYYGLFFFFKQKTAYEMRISDWSSDVCSSDLPTLTSGEMLLRCAVHLTEDGKDIADHFAKAHPVPRVRANAIEALAAVAEGEGRAALLERGTRDVDARVRDDCKRWLAS